MVWDKTSLFLYKAINSLPNDAQFNAIRSQMMLKIKAMNPTTEEVSKCATCGANYNEIPPHKEIRPTLEKNRFLRRQLSKDKYYRTKYQALCIKKSTGANYNNQQLITVCQRCKKQYKTKIIKPNCLLTSKRDLELDSTTKKKSKKKKKKEFAGLKKSAVLEAKQNLNSPNKDSIITINDTPERSSNDSVIILDSPISNKKTWKSNKFNPSNHTPHIANATNQGTIKTNGYQTHNKSSGNGIPLHASYNKTAPLKVQQRTWENANATLKRKMNIVSKLLRKNASVPKVKSKLDNFLEGFK